LRLLPSHAEIVHDHNTLKTGLVIGADGARSWVRQQAGILWGQRDYEQRGLVATFETEFAHGGVATQWFNEGDILALLPLADSHRVSMVWSTSRPAADIPHDPNELASLIQGRTQHRLGRLTMTSTITSAPLRMMLTESQSALRTVLVGDAGHTVHPLAGYGLNLGVQDLLALEGIWKEMPADPGSALLIARYERARQHRVKRVQWGLDLLQRLTVESHPTLARIRRLGMRLVADVGPLRQFLIRQAISPQ
jgi:ubiquinone biosynthesis UbiH/UbiF/VisC/COQ6 family hydroxylase